MKIMVINKDDIKSMFSMTDAIQADKDAMATWSQGKSIVPLRITFPVDKYEGVSQYMPAFDAGADAVGVKIVATYPKNIDKGIPTIPSLVVMVDAETGCPSALIDGTYLTRVRTGALSGAATDVLAVKDCKKFAMFGTGGQAESQLEAVLTVRPMIEEVYVFDLNFDRAKDFAQRMAKELGDKFKAKILPASSPEEAVRDADVITTVTTSPKPVFDGKLIKKGAHINAVGSYRPTTREIDETTVMRASKIYVDTRDGVLNEAGDLMIPIKEGKLDKDSVMELGEAIIGKVPNRTTEDEITLFKTVGFGGLDVVTGKRIVDCAKKIGHGNYIEL
ncbi:MAG: ornithine cyclodeaminase family protein [Clostridiales bacterium]|nr:ornithine cyclodeaminase family protein [Clostridiales bacterium]